MNAILREETQRRLDALTPKVEPLWNRYKEAERAAMPLVAAADTARENWAKVYNEIQCLKAMLSNEATFEEEEA